MIIKIDRNNHHERQEPIFTIDTKECHHPYAIKNAFVMAMKLDGYCEETVKEVFDPNYPEAVKVEE